MPPKVKEEEDALAFAGGQGTVVKVEEEEEKIEIKWAPIFFSLPHVLKKPLRKH